MVRPELFLDSCKTLRATAAQAVEDFPPGDRDFRPTGPPSRERIRNYAAELDHQSSAPRVAGGVWRSSLDPWIPQLAARPDSFYSEWVTRMDGSAVTRMEILQFTREQELTHRSQMFLYLRLKGVVPPTTRRRMARK